MAGPPHPSRQVTFIEVTFSPEWLPDGLSDPDDRFISWTVPTGRGYEHSSITITRSDGKVLSFEVPSEFFIGNAFVVQTRDNVIRWSTFPDLPGSEGAFQ